MSLFRKSNNRALDELAEVRQRIRSRAWSMAEDDGLDAGEAFARLRMAHETINSASLYASVGKERKKMDAAYISRVEQIAMEYVEGKDPVSRALESAR